MYVMVTCMSYVGTHANATKKRIGDAKKPKLTKWI